MPVKNNNPAEIPVKPAREQCRNIRKFGETTFELLSALERSRQEIPIAKNHGAIIGRFRNQGWVTTRKVNDGTVAKITDAGVHAFYRA